MQFPNSIWRVALWAVCVSTLWILELRAHTLPISFLTLVPDETHLHLELTFNPFELSFARELDLNRNGRIDPAEWQDPQARICERILAAFEIQVGDAKVNAENSGITPDLDSHHATLRAHYRVDARERRVCIRSTLNTLTSSSHLTQVTFRRGDQIERAQLDAQSTVAMFADPTSGTHRADTAAPSEVTHRDRVQPEEGSPAALAQPHAHRPGYPGLGLTFALVSTSLAALWLGRQSWREAHSPPSVDSSSDDESL